MALDDITLTDAQGTPVNHTMTYVSTSGNRVIRSDLSAPLEEPLLFTLAHSDTKIGGEKARSHLARIDKTVLDTDGVTGYKNNLRLMGDFSDKTLSDELLDDLRAMLETWLASDSGQTFRDWARGSVG